MIPKAFAALTVFDFVGLPPSPFSRFVSRCAAVPERVGSDSLSPSGVGFSLLFVLVPWNTISKWLGWWDIDESLLYWRVFPSTSMRSHEHAAWPLYLFFKTGAAVTAAQSFWVSIIWKEVKWWKCILPLGDYGLLDLKEFLVLENNSPL